MDVYVLRISRMCRSLCASVLFLVSLKGSTIVGGEIAPLKAKFTQEAFVPGGDE